MDGNIQGWIRRSILLSDPLAVFGSVLATWHDTC